MGAKEAFLTIKHRIKTFSQENSILDPLESYIRYKIINTNIYSPEEALIFANSLVDVPTQMRPRTLSCLLLENNQYLFFISSRLEITDV